MTEPLRYRPHHVLCSIGYEGKGYSDAFTANMTEIVMGGLRGPDGDKTVLEIVGEADAICAPCPSRRGQGCTAQLKIDRLDRSHAKALGLTVGEQLTWAAAKARIRERVQPGDLGRICAGCRWLPLGMCEAALARLHGDADGSAQGAAKESAAPA